MPVQPYLFFNGRTEEALDFYRRTLGAEVQMLMRFKDAPPCDGAPPTAPENAEKVMHACVQIAGSTVMASDGMCQGGGPQFAGFSLSLPVADAAEADRVFAALGDGGQVQMPLAETFFAPRFGVVADRFGVSWMVIVEPPATPAA
jgi:PhnB protein